MPASWYVMSSKPNKEEFLAGQLQARGVSVFHPRIRVRAVNPRSRKAHPYFPGYLFVNIDLTTINMSMLSFMPGATSLLTYGGEPASVSDSLIIDIQHHVDTINQTSGESFEELHKGDVVVILDGPFAGQEAIFDTRLSGSERVRVLLTLLRNRQLPVELIDGRLQRKIRRS